MPGLVPGLHAFNAVKSKTWMAGTSPAMTIYGYNVTWSRTPRLAAANKRRPTIKQTNLSMSALHDDRRADLGTIVQVDDVIVGHTNAA
jgi:hypothetical protein